MVTDLGFAKRARAFAELLDAPLAIVEKRRHGNLDRAEVINVIGEVRGRRVIIVDDEIDTAGTLIEITRALEKEGVKDIYACATHGVLSDPAIDRIASSSLAEVVITDTVPLPADKHIPRIKVLTVAPLIGEAIKRIHRGESVGALFSSEVSFTQEMLLWDDGLSGDAPGRRRRRTIGRARPGGRLSAVPRPRPPETHEPAAAPPRRQGRPRGPDTGSAEDHRSTLRSPRWGAALKGGELPELRNVEMNPTSTARSVAFWLVLGLITFGVIVAGYLSQVWRFPA